MDKQSGRDFDRPMYHKLLQRLEADDVLYIKSIDRLGRNYEEILEQWRIVTKEKRADIVVLDMPLLDTRKGKDLMGAFISDIALQILSFVAENEHKNIKRRQQEGIEAARIRGVKFGRPVKSLPDDFGEICCRHALGELSAKEAARRCNISTATFYRKRKSYSCLVTCGKGKKEEGKGKHR